MTRQERLEIFTQYLTLKAAFDNFITSQTQDDKFKALVAQLLDVKEE